MNGLAALLPAASIFESFSQFAEDAAAYGYWAIFLVVAGDGLIPILPGETAIVAAAVLAANGSLSLSLVILAGAAGAVAGDCSAYWIGRAGHGPIRRTVTRLAGARAPDGGRADGASARARRWSSWAASCPASGSRSTSRAGPGTWRSRASWPSTCIGGIVWSSQAALLGYFAGKAFADQLWVAFVVAFAVTGLVGGFVALKERKRIRRERLGGRADPADAPAPGRREGGVSFLLNSPTGPKGFVRFLGDAAENGVAGP